MFGSCYSVLAMYVKSPPPFVPSLHPAARPPKPKVSSEADSGPSSLARKAPARARAPLRIWARTAPAQWPEAVEIHGLMKKAIFSNFHWPENRWKQVGFSTRGGGAPVLRSGAAHGPGKKGCVVCIWALYGEVGLQAGMRCSSSYIMYCTVLLLLLLLLLLPVSRRESRAAVDGLGPSRERPGDVRREEKERRERGERLAPDG